MDAAKGVTITLVVLRHTYWAVLQAGASVQAWAPVDWALTWLRMPLFFLLAGLFARTVVHGPALKLWRDRVGKFVYLVAVWSVLQVAFLTVGAAMHGRHDVGVRFLERATEIFDGESVLWFIQALAIAFAMARVVRWLHPVLQIAVASGLGLLLVVFDVGGLPGKLWLLPFFLIGCNYGPQIRGALDGSAFDQSASRPGFRWLRYMGRRTLPIYLMHVPALGLLAAPFVHSLILETGEAAPLLMAALVTAASLAVHKFTRRIPGLYDLPRTWTRKREAGAGA